MIDKVNIVRRSGRITNIELLDKDGVQVEELPCTSVVLAWNPCDAGTIQLGLHASRVTFEDRS